jgi:hypothetical protein
MRIGRDRESKGVITPIRVNEVLTPRGTKALFLPLLLSFSQTILILYTFYISKHLVKNLCRKIAIVF